MKNVIVIFSSLFVSFSAFANNEYVTEELSEPGATCATLVTGQDLLPGNKEICAIFTNVYYAIKDFDMDYCIKHSKFMVDEDLLGNFIEGKVQYGPDKYSYCRFRLNEKGELSKYRFQCGGR